jgi:hypothetical protein
MRFAHLLFSKEYLGVMFDESATNFKRFSMVMTQWFCGDENMQSKQL